MPTTLQEIRELITPSRRHREYLMSEFVQYCNDIRSAFDGLDDPSARDSDVVRFFEKQFVEEMEVISRICVRQFETSLQNAAVQYIQNDPPDGVVSLPDGDQIFIECTSARDSRWENFALEQLRRHGRIVSLSGYEGRDLTGSRNRGYQLKGMDVTDPSLQEFLVEADEQNEVIARHCEHICEKIENKLSKVWQQRCNWLSVYVNEFTMPGGSYRCMIPVLNGIVATYRERLQSKYIEALVFVSNRIDDGYYSFHLTH